MSDVSGIDLVAPQVRDLRQAAAFDGPFGRTFSFDNPDGCPITIHDKG
jgi:hypothetical protein